MQPSRGSIQRAKEFRNALIAARSSHPVGAAVEVKPLEFYAAPSTRLFLSPDKTAGAAVTGDGELISVFRRRHSPTAISEILAKAASFARKLDAFASGNGFLPNLYATFGFRPIARVAFDRKHAPPGIERVGSPDVVFMVRDLDGATGAPQVTGNYAEQSTHVPLVSHSDALTMRDRAIARTLAYGIGTASN